MIFQDATSLREWRDSFPENKTLVVTNGCFDILHLGHVRYLKQAKSLGNFLLVGINSDSAVSLMKGPSRPINNQTSRLEVVDALRAVNGVYLFNTVNAKSFLEIARPNVYVKGGDYTLQKMNRHEVSVLQQLKSRIYILNYVDGYSTTSIIDKIKP